MDPMQIPPTENVVLHFQHDNFQKRFKPEMLCTHLFFPLISSVERIPFLHFIKLLIFQFP